MKKILVLFLITTAFIITGFDNNSNNNSIVGTWTTTEEPIMEYTFNEDGTGKLTADGVDISFKYTTKGNTLTFTVDKGATIEETYKINNNKLTIDDSYGNKEVYVRK